MRDSLAALLPPGVEVEAGVPGSTAAFVLPEEEAAIVRAVPARREEFALGRSLARVGLARLGVDAGALLPRADRAPEWPAGIVGSISHTRSLCAVAVARRGAVVSLGIDLEDETPLESELWRRTLTPGELAWIGRAPSAEQGALAKLVFSAKESFYKCQHPLTRRFLDFLEVELRLDLATGRYAVQTTSVEVHRVNRFDGRFTRAEGHIVTSALLLAD